jgi:hypothetical protein
VVWCSIAECSCPSSLRSEDPPPEAQWFVTAGIGQWYVHPRHPRAEQVDVRDLRAGVCYRAFFVVSCHFSFSINNCVIVYYKNVGIAISKKFIL